MSDYDLLPTLGQRLHVAGALLSYVQKDGFNDHHKYNYVSEAAIKSAVSKAYQQVGLFIAAVRFEPVLGLSTGTNIVMQCTVTVGGVGLAEAATFVGIGQGSDKQDKAAMKAAAASLKYALTAAHLIATGDDPEATEAPETRQPTEGTPAKLATNVERIVSDIKAVALIRDIQDCPSANELEFLRARVKALAGTPEYDTLKSAFSSRKTALESKGSK